MEEKTNYRHPKHGGVKFTGRVVNPFGLRVVQILEVVGKGVRDDGTIYEIWGRTGS